MKAKRWFSLLALLFVGLLLSCGGVPPSAAPAVALTNTPLPLPTAIGSPSYPSPQPSQEVVLSPIRTTVATAIVPSSKINKDLTQIINTSSDNTQITFYAVLTEQSVFNDNISNLSPSQKGDYILRKDKEVADRTQPAVEKALIELKREGAVIEYKAISIPNCFLVVGTTHAIEILAARNDVQSLQPTYEIHIPELTQDPSQSLQPTYEIHIPELTQAPSQSNAVHVAQSSSLIFNL